MVGVAGKAKRPRERKDARFIRCDRKIFKAIQHILKHKPLARITIAEICKKSGIFKTTFYRHYRYVDQIIQEKDITIFSSCLEVYFRYCKLKKIPNLKIIFHNFTINSEELDPSRIRSFYKRTVKTDLNIGDLIPRPPIKHDFSLVSSQIFKTIEKERSYLKDKIYSNNLDIFNHLIIMLHPALMVNYRLKYPRSHKLTIKNRVHKDIFEFKFFIFRLFYFWAKESDKTKREKYFISTLSTRLHELFD